MPKRQQAAQLPRGLVEVIGARTKLLSMSLALLDCDLNRRPGSHQAERIRELDRAAVMLAKALEAHRADEILTPAQRLARIKVTYPKWMLEQSGNKLTARKAADDGRIIAVEAGSVVELERRLGEVKE